MNHSKATDYTVVMHMSNGDTQEVDEWFSLGVARKIAAKAIETRKTVVNSQVTAIEVRDFNGKTIEVTKFN